MIRRFRFLLQVLSLLVFTALISTDILPNAFRRIVYSLHIFPTLEQIRLGSLSWMLLLTLVVLLLPLALGRFYCSYICPAGFLQDLAGRIARKLQIEQGKIRPLYWMSSSLIAGFCLTALIIGYSEYGYFDHFSNFSRLAAALISFSTDSDWLLLCFIFFALLLPLSLPRFFCAAICPSGALFAFFARKGIYRVRSGPGCIGCGKCEVQCPAGCIDKAEIKTEFCIGCLECTELCPTGVFYYGRKKDLPDDSAGSRRSFFRLILCWAAGTAVASVMTVKKGLAEKRSAVFPPGALSFERFSQACHFCGICAALCPTRVLKPAAVDAQAVLPEIKPQMDYDAAYCAFECNICLQVCPSLSLKPMELADKKRVQIGKAELNKDLCIPYVKERDCAACAEHCPTGAIRMEYLEGRHKPVMEDRYCIGCGACQHACPVEPKRAILVHGISPHGTAEVKEVKPLAAQTDQTGDDFPF